MTQNRNQTICRRIFSCWSALATERVSERNCLHLASDIFETKLAKKVLHVLRRNVTWQRVKIDLLARAESYRQTRLLRSSFQLWISSHHSKQRELEKSSCAMYVWALRLQFKSLMAWKDFLAARRLKRSRYADALEQHHRLLKREGARCILAASGSLRYVRLSSSANQKAREAEDLNRRLQACIRHWREFAKKRAVERRKRLIEAPPPKKREDPSLPPDRLVLPGRVEAVLHQPRRQPRCPQFLSHSNTNKNSKLVSSLAKAFEGSRLTPGQTRGKMPEGVCAHGHRHETTPASKITTSVNPPMSQNEKVTTVNQSSVVNFPKLLPPSYFEEEAMKDDSQTRVDAEDDDGRSGADFFQEISSLRGELKDLLHRKTLLAHLEKELDEKENGDDNQTFILDVEKTRNDIKTLKSVLDLDKPRIKKIHERIKELTLLAVD